MCAQVLTAVEQEKIESTRIRKLEADLKLQRLQNAQDKLVHREAMLKDWVINYTISGENVQKWTRVFSTRS